MEKIDVGIEFAGRPFKTAIKLEHIPGRFRGYDELMVARKSGHLRGGAVSDGIPKGASKESGQGTRDTKGEKGDQSKEEGKGEDRERGEGESKEEELQGEQEEGNKVKVEKSAERGDASAAAPSRDNDGPSDGGSQGKGENESKSKSESGGQTKSDGEGKEKGDDAFLPAVSAEAAALLLEYAQSHRQ